MPLFAMTSAPLRVEIQLVSSDIQAVNAVTGTTHSNGLVTNVEYIASMIELSDSAMQMIESSLGGEAYYPFSCVDYGLLDYQFRLGPILAPPKPVDDIASMFSELTKSIGSMSDLTFTPSVRKSSNLICKYC